MNVETREGLWVVPAHRGLWIPRAVEHSIRIAGAVSMRTLYISPTVSKRLPTSCRVVHVSPLLREIILDVVARGGADRSTAVGASLVTMMLDQLDVMSIDALELKQPEDPRAVRFAQRLLSSPGDRRPLKPMLRGAGASLRTMERLFVTETGTTIGRWRQQLRLIHALQMLATDASVTTVALDVGYESVSAFIAAFRAAFGVTPGRYFRAQPNLVDTAGVS